VHSAMRCVNAGERGPPYLFASGVFGHRARNHQVRYCGLLFFQSMSSCWRALLFGCIIALTSLNPRTNGSIEGEEFCLALVSVSHCFTLSIVSNLPKRTVLRSAVNSLSMLARESSVCEIVIIS